MPSSRSSARRHRGRSPMVSRTPRPREPKVVTLDHDDPATVAAWWRQQLDRPLFVYFIQEVDGGPVKIGQALDPKGRLAELQCGNPRVLKLRAVVLATDETEQSLHYAWGHAAVRGEWFDDDRLLPLARRAQIEQIARGPSYNTAAMSRHLVRPSEAGWRSA